jgi:hypothetical protein
MKNYIEKSMTFEVYNDLVEKLVAEGKTTGPNQSEELTKFTELNQYRMRRLEKTIQLTDSLIESVGGLKVNWFWLVLTEGWCGDAAQNIPIIEKIAAVNPGIQTRYLLRDENLELMDKYLTNGGRAIPKMICLDAENFKELGVWGSRPKAADDYFKELKAQGMEKPQIIENIQRWYNDDKGKSLQSEFEKLTAEWSRKS